ncbi:ribonuclease H family protein [Marinifilum caeruleilacunae]|uniref:ribonuclease H family protein n=1 Tax=Marinifilum caeruleilacunae TaxID=2499076 RepID=UPI003211BC83
MIKVILLIQSKSALKIECLLSDGHEEIQLSYFPEERTIVCLEDTSLSKMICKLKLQFEKVIRTSIKGKLNIGQSISCVFIDGFNFLNRLEFNRYIRVDRLAGKLEITTSQSGLRGIHKIYADGSHSAELNQSGYAGFIESTTGIQEIYYESYKDGSSNLMELLAVIEGLKRVGNQTKIQVNTDSRFVIRGVVQWIHFWKHNNWQTAYGNEVKFVQYWKLIDELCENKLIELKWIKGNSDNNKQAFCHQLARKSANSQK